MSGGSRLTEDMSAAEVVEVEVGVVVEGVGVDVVEVVEDRSRSSDCGFSRWEKSTADAEGGM